MFVSCWLLGIEIDEGGEKQKKPRPETRLFDDRDQCFEVASSDRGLRLTATSAQDAESGNEAADAS